MTVALAAPHSEAVDAGRRAIAAGGNALDAALAAAVMLTVVYPHQCALGGDVIALVRAPSGSTTAVIAAGTAPAAIAGVARDWREVPRAGAHSVTVPGMVSGWQEIAALGARLSLAPSFSDAALTAREGTVVSAGLARAITSRAPGIFADEGLRGVFCAEGRPLAEGDVLLQLALADTMDALAEDPHSFYDGPIAASLVRTLREGRGVHTLEDFAGYRAEVTDALSAQIGGARWFVAPPPSGGAILLGVAAAVAEEADASPAQPLRASVRGAHSRAAHLGDPRAGDIDLDAMLSLAPAPAHLFAQPRPNGDTAAVVAVDDEGWAVTIVQSVYQTFGAGLLDPETGILLHNRGSAFSADADAPAGIRPGARPPHTLVPAIVDSGDVLVVAGCQGGRAQPWILAQLLPDVIDPDVALGDVLSRPRWVIGDRDLGHPVPTFVSEPGIPDGLIAEAARLDLAIASFAGPADEAGHVQLVRRSPGAGVEAASDPRADGAGITV